MTKVPATQLPKQQQILDKLDKGVTGTLAITTAGGGITFQNMGEVLEFAKLMSISQQAVPPHCRNQPGVCLGIVIQAVEWRMSPYAVAQKSYVVSDRLSYESQLIHAIIEQRAPIKGRLRCEYSGEGTTRRCKVWGTPRNEDEPLEYTSPEFAQIQPKNSPMWKTKPDLQLFYNTVRDWARMFYPDVIMGVYSEDEMERYVTDAGGVKQAGMQGLKKRLIARNEEIKQQISDDVAAIIDAPYGEEPPAAESPALTTPDAPPEPESSPSEMTPEEWADQEREREHYEREQRLLYDDPPC